MDGTGEVVHLRSWCPLSVANLAHLRGQVLMLVSEEHDGMATWINLSCGDIQVRLHAVAQLLHPSLIGCRC